MGRDRPSHLRELAAALSLLDRAIDRHTAKQMREYGEEVSEPNFGVLLRPETWGIQGVID